MTMGRSNYPWRDQLVENAEVYGSDGEKIGHLAAADANYIMVQKGWLFIKDIYLPTSSIARVEADRVYLSYTKAEAEQMGREQLPAEGDAWYGTTAGTTPTGYDTSGYAADRTGTNYDTTTHATAGTGATGYGTGRDVREGENVSVPVVEEQLKAGVRETEAGRARVVKDVRQEQQSIDVPVEREDVYVTERAVNRPATKADLNQLDRDIEIPLKEQEAVVQKEARVTGEVNIRKDVKRDTERVSDTVRREDVHVEDPNNPRVHVEGLTDAQRRRYDAMSADERQRYAGMSATDRAAYDREYDGRGMS
jgi:uncharacterized protein (TIGR02271 family)